MEAHGRVGGLLAGTPMMLIHHVGAKSGIKRVTPLAYTPKDDRRYVIVASNGHPGHPHCAPADMTPGAIAPSASTTSQAARASGFARAGRTSSREY